MQKTKSSRAGEILIFGTAALMATFTVAALAIDNSTQETRQQELTVTGLTGPTLYDTKWVVETDKGLYRLNGLSWRKDRPDLIYAGDIAAAFEKGAAYCVETVKPGKLTEALAEASGMGAEMGNYRKLPYMAIISRKVPGKTCDYSRG
jgi:hypothetical protein